MGALLSHLFMPVGDLAAARAFWTEAIGLEVLMEYPGYVRVGGGGGFHIGMEQGDPGPGTRTEISVYVDDVDAVHRRLLDRGVEVEGPPQDQPWGARHCWLRDPDGRRMSIFT
ncbi:MAG TPA: VOC family protein [Acidimicrobiia bacterium]|nr:VOC family protein [Acidimicrobiia bacterium]